MDARIILAGQQPDILGIMGLADEYGQQRRTNDRTNALAQLYQTQGPGIAAGEPGALNALAQFDPMAAMDVQDSATQRQRDEQEWQWKLADYAKKIGTEKATAEAAMIERGVKAGLTAQTPQEWDALVTQYGAPDLVGQFANRDAVASAYMSMADVLKGRQPPDPTTSQRDYQFYTAQETQAGRQPLSFNEWDLQSRRAGATNVTVGGSTKQEIGAFNKGVKAGNVKEVIADIRATDKAAILPTTGMVGSMLSNVGGTAAGDIAANINTLKAAASFSALQAMRDASPTGAALGAVSDTEIKLLGSELANLEQSQSREQFMRNLDRFERVYNEIVNGPQGAPPPTANGAIAPPAPALPQGVTQEEWDVMTPEERAVFQ
jgi:hypothetical protein